MDPPTNNPEDVANNNNNINSNIDDVEMTIVEPIELSDCSNNSSPSYTSAKENETIDTVMTCDNQQDSDKNVPEEANNSSNEVEMIVEVPAKETNPIEGDPLKSTEPEKPKEPEPAGHRVGTFHDPIKIRLPSATFKEPYFRFGPYIPLMRKDNEIIIQTQGIVKEFVDSNPCRLAKRLNREILPEDSILETPSIICPLLLKKRTKWPARYEDLNERSTSTSPIASTTESSSANEANSQVPSSKESSDAFDEEADNEYLICNQRIDDKRYEFVKVFFKSDDLKDENELTCADGDKFRNRNDYIRQAITMSLVKDQSKIYPTKPHMLKDFNKTLTSELLMDIGTSQVKEFNLEQDLRKLKRKRPTEDDEIAEHIDEFESLQAELKRYREANQPYKPTGPRLECNYCDFKTDSILIMVTHLENPHSKARYGEFGCNWCDFKTRDQNILEFHCKISHRKLCKFEKPHGTHMCNYCPYETNHKRRFQTHMSSCERNFLRNAQMFLGPQNYELDEPPAITSKPITRTDVLSYEQILKDMKLSGRNLNPIKVANCLNPILNSLLVIPRSQIASNANQQTELLEAAQRQQQQLQLANSTFQLDTSTSSNKRTKSAASGGQRFKRPYSVDPFADQPRGIFEQFQLLQSKQIAAFGSAGAASLHQSDAIRLLASQNVQLNSIPNGNHYPRLNTSMNLINQAAITNGQNDLVGGRSLVVNGRNYARKGRRKVKRLSASSGVIVGSGEANNDAELEDADLTHDAQFCKRKSLPADQRIPSEQPGKEVDGHDDMNGNKQKEQQQHQDERSEEHTFVICEICDSYIADLCQLKVHMFHAHKIKIQQKMLKTKPPLACQKCQWRFFTDQGLERHLLGLHGLVTTTLQDQADKDADSGRCTKCGKAFSSKLVNHMKEAHKVVLKAAHLTYKCTGCGATFNQFRLFESHVYSVHGDSMKRKLTPNPQAGSQQMNGNNALAKRRGPSLLAD